MEANREIEGIRDWKDDHGMRNRDTRDTKRAREDEVGRSKEVETLVRRSFWEDLANIKVKLSKKSSTKCREEESSESRDSWYRTSRRYSDSRVRRSMRKKPIRERTSSSYKEGGKRKAVRKPTRASNQQVERGDASKEVYREILDIVNVNNPNTLPGQRDRMAQWVLTSRNQSYY